MTLGIDFLNTLIRKRSIQAMEYTGRQDRPIGYGTEPAPVVVADYHDRVRWGPIFAGLAVTLSTQLVLSALSAGIGATNIAGSGAPRSSADEVGLAVGVSSVVSLLISLLVGGWVTARTCGPIKKRTGLLNGAILWATTLVISAWLLSSGVSGAFGIAASNAGTVLNQAQQSGVNVPNNVPGPTTEQARAIARNLSKASLAFAIGSLLGLGATLTGASIGTREPDDVTPMQTVQ
jgi:hypothetical protein